MPTSRHTGEDSLSRIEELERAVEDARRTNDQYSRILSQLSDAIWQFDRSFRCIFVNKAAERATGIPEHMFLNHTASELDLPAETNAAGVAALREVFETGKERTADCQIPTPEGPRYIHARFCPHSSPDGTTVKVTVIARDVTDEKRRAAELDRARADLNRVLESITESFLVLDRDWRFTYVNAQVLRTTGRGPEELIGHRIWDVFPTLVGSTFDTEFHRVMRERVPVRFQTGSGTGGRWFEVHAYPAEPGISAYVADVTSQRNAEQEVRGAHKMVQALVQASPLPIIAYTPEGIVTVWNAAAEQTFGWTHDEVIGKPLPFIPDESVDEHRAMSALELEGQAFKGLDVTRRRKDGSQIDIVVSTAPIREDADNVTGMLSVYQDVTEGRKIEQQLARHAQELARSNADLQQFAFVTSHDLQEPLRAITSYAQLLARRYHEKLDDDADEFLNFIVDGAARMQRLINDLLTFSRILHGEERALSEVDIDVVFSWAVMNLNTAIQETGAVITHDPLPTVTANEQEIIQLFQNLLGNAIKYHAAAPPVIHIGVEKRAEDYCFSVSDNGIGIDPAHHEHIFGVFKRLHGKNVAGTGIGLALCKRIVEKHGGRIWVESQAGQGATFFFTLPN